MLWRMYFSGVGWTLLCTSVRSIWSMKWFNSDVYLFICLDDGFTDESGVLSFRTIIVLKSFSPSDPNMLLYINGCYIIMCIYIYSFFCNWFFITFLQVLTYFLFILYKYRYYSCFPLLLIWYLDYICVYWLKKWVSLGSLLTDLISVCVCVCFLLSHSVRLSLLLSNLLSVYI